MFTYEMTYDSQYKHTPGGLVVRRNNRLHDVITFFMSGEIFYFYDKDKTLFIGHGRKQHFFRTLDEAIDAAKGMYNPFDYAIEKLNKRVDHNFKSAQQQMHLRLAEFRGNLFSQIQTLRS